MGAPTTEMESSGAIEQESSLSKFPKERSIEVAKENASFAKRFEGIGGGGESRSSTPSRMIWTGEAEREAGLERDSDLRASKALER